MTSFLQWILQFLQSITILQAITFKQISKKHKKVIIVIYIFRYIWLRTRTIKNEFLRLLPFGTINIGYCPYRKIEFPRQNAD